MPKMSKLPKMPKIVERAFSTIDLIPIWQWRTFLLNSRLDGLVKSLRFYNPKEGKVDVGFRPRHDMRRNNIPK